MSNPNDPPKYGTLPFRYTGHQLRQRRSDDRPTYNLVLSKPQQDVLNTHIRFLGIGGSFLPRAEDLLAIVEELDMTSDSKANVRELVGRVLGKVVAAKRPGKGREGKVVWEGEGGREGLVGEVMRLLEEKEEEGAAGASSKKAIPKGSSCKSRVRGAAVANTSTPDPVRPAIEDAPEDEDGLSIAEQIAAERQAMKQMLQEYKTEENAIEDLRKAIDELEL